MKTMAGCPQHFAREAGTPSRQRATAAELRAENEGRAERCMATEEKMWARRLSEA